MYSILKYIKIYLYFTKKIALKKGQLRKLTKKEKTNFYKLLIINVLQQTKS